MESKNLVLIKDTFQIKLKRCIIGLLVVPVIFDSKVHAVEILNDMIRNNNLEKGIDEGTVQSLVTDFHINLKDYYCFCYSNKSENVILGYRFVEMIDTRFDN
jgi:hypothetical protein